MQEKYDSLTKATDAFCDAYLDEDYKQLIRLAIAALSRKRPSPLTRGKEATWAAGVVHAVGTVNFLFDKSQKPHCKAPLIYEYFGVGSSTGPNKSKEIRDLLGMSQFGHEWMLPARLKSSRVAWMVQVNGLIVDIRTMPYEVQELAYQKGLIPYIPDAEPDDQI
ncbi:hypothetical protein D779_4011 [Imhoffiella purpurea]|uniref:DUF6398 domain-containing protein n=2 Tax=Imhoffiella purpurea TaxID=1249627 RepID=W9VAV9_9GAMM|nr:hypothetical protein D779_4011 [Imhoffiella purpurea]